ncbi:hypothetical protein BD408DRAFT_432732 [Parasitella parasitica]|nr:hypothetical protein BD408DRAFT_432732 [Parasitella parasitica]
MADYIDPETFLVNPVTLEEAILWTARALLSQQQQKKKFPGSPNPIMLIGDRGHGISSPIKPHQRWGGSSSTLDRFTPVFVTNEHNSRQTCLWCFRKLSHPYITSQGIAKTTSGSFLCLKKSCSNKYRVLSRNQVSALAIGLAGSASLWCYFSLLSIC